MSWDNYGNGCGAKSYNCSWDLDHIKPTCLARKEEDIYILNHWSNFQPLCSKVNRHEKKGIYNPCSNTVLTHLNKFEEWIQSKQSEID